MLFACLPLPLYMRYIEVDFNLFTVKTLLIVMILITLNVVTTSRSHSIYNSFNFQKNASADTAYLRFAQKNSMALLLIINK